MRKRLLHGRSGGFSLIELLMVVGIIGVLAAIVIWQYLGAIQKGRGKKTMADMHSLGVALEARATDNGGYNAAGSFAWPANVLAYSDVVAELQPTYTKQIPMLDGWNRPFEFAVNQPLGSTTRADTYGIRSGGRDGVFEASYDTEETSNFDCDIVFTNGTFVAHPKTN
ncbi:MAG TPA: prepilin-type N-terminal cleavage/methylation domain-containing protein [Thermoanaerobaculia bacterium]|nr:prepilin-type N-terminal cleavage/methylation domain-containing protein [Thermoanaerobaculia bacterium]